MEELKIGDIIKQRYSLIQFLGSGSFGEVWLAHDQMTGRDVALKIYLSLDPAGVEEFQREYSNTADLSSPYLLTPEYFDVHNRRPFLVMKYCANGSSSKLAGQISEDKLWAFIHDVASGLEVLHSQSDPIVHQDIKPDNILVDSNGRFLITDFGISKRLRATMRRQSKRDVSSGAMPYMAPERFYSNPRLNTSSDIWSLGASIYELAMGELPFSGFGGAMQRNGADMPSLDKGFSSVLNEIMQRCLNPDAGNRPTAVDLSKWAKSKTIPAKTSEDSHKTIAKQPVTIQESKSQNASVKSSSHTTTLVVLPALAILVYIAIIVWSPFNSDNIGKVTSQSVTTDSITERVDEIQSLTAEQQIINSACITKDGKSVHFYKGAFYYENDIYPVLVSFIVADQHIQKVIYKNVTYGSRIAMSCQTQENEILLSGKDGNNNFTMLLSAGDDNRLLGTAVDGNKSMTVRLMPTDESFEISESLSVEFSKYNLGDGEIKIPLFLHYKGESDDGGPMFADSSNQIRLFADYARNQDLKLYLNWVIDEVGNGTILVSNDNCFVISGYTMDKEVYYCKAYMDYNTYPPIMYTATIIYPVSRRNEIDGLLSNIFNSFPNLK